MEGVRPLPSVRPRPLQQPCRSPGSRPCVQKHLLQACEQLELQVTPAGRAMVSGPHQRPSVAALGAWAGSPGEAWLRVDSGKPAFARVPSAPLPQCPARSVCLQAGASSPDPRNAYHVRGTVENVPESIVIFEKKLCPFPSTG